MSQTIETPLVSNLKKKMESFGLTIPELERKANLKTHAVWNIMLGRSKNPNIETLKALAKALECNIEELISSEHGNEIESNAYNNKIENPELYIKVVELALKEFYKKNITPSISQLNKVIPEIYSYFHSKKKDIDSDFIALVVSKSLRL